MALSSLRTWRGTTARLAWRSLATRPSGRRRLPLAAPGPNRTSSSSQAASRAARSIGSGSVPFKKLVDDLAAIGAAAEIATSASNTAL